MEFILYDDLTTLVLSHVTYKEHRFLEDDQLHLLRPSHKYISEHLTEYPIDQIHLLLKDERVDPSVNDNAAIKWASESGHIDIVRLFLADNRVDPNDDNNYAIRRAIENGHTEIFTLLNNDDRCPPINIGYAFMLASTYGRTSMFKLLLDERSLREPTDTSTDDATYIGFASNNGHIEVVQLLLSDSRVDLSNNGGYALAWASNHDHIDIVQLLLADGRFDQSAANNCIIGLASNWYPDR